MVLPRKKCRILITWVILIALLQVLIYSVLFGELESVPRKNLFDKISKLRHARDVYPIDGRKQELNTRDSLKTFNSKKTKIIAQSIDLADIATRNKIFLSRKLEKFKISKESLPKTVTSPSTFTLERKSDKNTAKTSKVSNNISKLKFVPKARRPSGPDDIFISVKTTKQYHNNRVDEVLMTWWSLAKRWTYFFTDADDAALNQRIDGHLINTKCTSGHTRAALCCKLQLELNFFWEKIKKRWFCHFDDDNYVNFPALIKLLQQYNHSEALYLGKASLERKMQSWDNEDGNKEVKFWFATGGAGFCLSHALVSLMVPYFSGGAFVKTCSRIGLPDDCTVGFISEYLLGVKLTKIDGFHSHLEWLEGIPVHELREQVSLSHGYIGKQYMRIKIQGPFSIEQDPSRFKSLHCNLYPQTQWCNRSLVNA